MTTASTHPLRPLLALVVLAPLALAGCAEGGKFSGVPGFNRAEQPCRDMSFPIYFDRGSDQLTQDARMLVSMTATRVKSCNVRSAEVVGLAASIEPGDAGNAAQLSERRAVVVAKALADSGLPTPRVVTAGEGRSGATTPGGAAEPLRRRTEVVLRPSPR